MTRQIAVTGSGGYVGGRLIQHLRSTGSVVRPLARSPVPWVPDAVLMDLAQAEVSSISEAISGCAAVVHLAGSSEVHAARDPDGALASTTAATRRVALAAAAAGVETFVYLSTIHVYGAALERGGRIDESVLPEPRHSYAVARLAGEHLAAAADVGALVVLRLTNSVGAPVDPRVDRWTLVATELCQRASAGQPLRLRSSGRQWRDFVDLGDVCRSIGAAAEGEVPAGVYNLGSGRASTVLELAELIAEVAGETGEPRPHVEAPPHVGRLPPPARIDISRLGRHIPAPAVPLDASVRELIALCRSVGDIGSATVQG